jgi:hypothetical protein
MNIAFLNHELPRPTDIYYTVLSDGDLTDFLPDRVESNIDVFIIVGVSDEQIRMLYANANDEIEAIQLHLRQVNETNSANKQFEAQFKRLYRFDSIKSAIPFVDYLSSLLRDACEDSMEDCEEILRDRLESWFLYEEPRIFARELTERDWMPGGLFYEELNDNIESDDTTSL